MEISVYLDLKKEHIEKKGMNSELIEYVVANPVSPEFMVIISDDVDAATKWADYAVIGVEKSEQIKGVSYVTDSLINIDKEFVKLAYCRRFNLPVIIKETKRLVIREMQLSDVGKICDLYEDKENVQFLPPIKTYEEEMELARAYIRNMYGIYGYGLWVVILKETGRIIGRVGIEHRDIDGEIYHELGYMIAKEYQGMGLGHEAAAAALEFAAEYGIEEIIAYINAQNTPSVNLAIGLDARKIKTINDGAEEFILFRF